MVKYIYDYLYTKIFKCGPDFLATFFHRKNIPNIFAIKKVGKESGPFQKCTHLYLY